MQSSYIKFILILSINTLVMFLLTYALIDRFEHFYVNINRVYMALIMVAPMAILMLIVMRHMYRNAAHNAGLVVAFILMFAGVFLLARTQTPVGDVQFLRSMIPHHSSASLMCERSAITDPEIVALCGQIIEAQEKEIAQMKEILARY